MSMKNEFEITLFNEKNESIVGTLTIDGYQYEQVIDTKQINGIDPGISNVSIHGSYEEDPDGAVSYVVTVVMIYGLAIVFMIASHVFVKKKEERLENQLRNVDKYFQQAHGIRERGARESYRKLKHSIVPVVAKSTARDLVSRRKSFAPILAQAGIILDQNGSLVRKLSTSSVESLHSTGVGGGQEDAFNTDNKQYLTVPSFLELPPRLADMAHMPSISEEEQSSDNDKGIPEIHKPSKVYHDMKNPQNFSAYSNYGIHNDYRIPSYQSTWHQQGTLQIPQIQVSPGELKETQILLSSDEDLEVANLLSAYESGHCISIESLNVDQQPLQISDNFDQSDVDLELGDRLHIPETHNPALYQMTWVSEKSIDSYKPSTAGPSLSRESPHRQSKRLHKQAVVEDPDQTQTQNPFRSTSDSDSKPKKSKILMTTI